MTVVGVMAVLLGSATPRSSAPGGDQQVPAIDQHEQHDLEGQRDDGRLIIIMPIDISTEATTMSMMRKGMKTMKPIWKAVFSSEVTKAGITTRIGRSSALSIAGLGELGEEVEVGLRGPA